MSFILVIGRWEGDYRMKKEIIGISILLFMAGCSNSNLFLNDTQKVNMESSVDQKAVYSYIKKAQAHLSIAPNYNPAVQEEKLLKMASDSFQISVGEAALIYTAYEYGE